MAHIKSVLNREYPNSIGTSWDSQGQTPYSFRNWLWQHVQVPALLYMGPTRWLNVSSLSSEGRNSLWFIYPTLNRPWGKAVIWIWPSDTANQFQTFLIQVKIFSKFTLTGIWSRDLLHQKREFKPLRHAPSSSYSYWIHTIISALNITAANY